MPSPSLDPRPGAGRPRWKPFAAIATLPLLAVGVTAPQTSALAQPSAPAHSVGTPGPAVSKVTLITGDVVTVTTLGDGTQTAEVQRPAAAVGGVRIQQVHGDLYVVPDEARTLLAADKLDRRLFDVTDLIEMGYDDAHSAGVPLIASYTAPAARTAAPIPAAPKGSRLGHKFTAIGAASLNADKKQSRTFWRTIAPNATRPAATPMLGAGVAKIWLDGRVKVNLAESVPQIGAPEAWAAGYDGHGVKVAVLDSGVDATHPDLVNQIDDKVSFVPGQDTSDRNGHGTHVASTIVGTGAASDGKYKGVAPGADLIVGKVLGDDGFGADSWIIAGMEWAARSGASVVSMSLGDPTLSDGTDPMSAAVDALSAQYGTLFVIASGNAGPETIGSPGAAASALTVGAVDKQDYLAYFSSTGPQLNNGSIKPDITAPGVDITAARSQQQDPAEGDGYYWTISGTSMATPHVSGSAAILKQRHPDWTGVQLKDALMSSAKGLADYYSPFEVGTGRVDVAAAVKNSVRATGSLSWGMYAWPHGPEDQPVTKNVTFSNSGAADVTLNLALQGSGPFSLADNKITIPAGGKAEVAVTGDPTTPDVGKFGAWIVGTDAATGTPTTRTSLGMVKEDERYDLTIKLRDRSGDPAQGVVVVNKSGDFWPSSVQVDGAATFRVPPGIYTLDTALDVPGSRADRLAVAFMVAPEVDMHQARTVVLDASKARLLDIAAPRKAEQHQKIVDYRVEYGDGTEYRSANMLPIKYDEAYYAPTAKMSNGTFTLDTHYREAEPMLSLSTVGGLIGFDTTVQPGSALTAGTSHLKAVYAHSGSAADFAKVNAQGKIAVVTRTDAVAPDQRVANAIADGAAMLIVVNDGPGVLNEYVGESAIPVATVHRDAGQLLVTLAKTGVLVFDAKRVPYASYLFDLSTVWTGQVPDQPLVYRPSLQQLAEVDNRFYAQQGVEGGGFRYDMTFTPSIGFGEREYYPGTRTEYVTPGTRWHENHTQDFWEDRAGENSYEAGRPTTVDWFAPAVHPSFGDGYGVRNGRARDYMTINVQSWTPSGPVIDHGGAMGWGEQPEHVWLYQGGTLIDENPMASDLQWVQVPAGRQKYRLVHEASQDKYRLSTRTHTEWEFFSDTVDSDYFQPMALLELDYRLATDLHGDAKAGRPLPISVLATPQDGGGGEAVGPVTKVTLDVSYDDGRTWQKVTLAKTNGAWTGSLKPPHRAGFISLRASAVSGAGYTIKQAVIRAYGLA